MKSALLGLCLGFVPLAVAAEGTFSIKVLTPDTALKAAQAALKKCRDGGFQATVAVVDRSTGPAISGTRPTSATRSWS
jgi:hypothetical protein